MTAPKKKRKGVPKIINVFSKLISDLMTSSPSVGRKLTFEDITKISSRAVDKTIVEIEKRDDVKFVSGRFFITEQTGGATFKTSVIMYFARPDEEPYYEIRREGPAFTLSRLNADAINMLKALHELAFKITPP